MSSQKLLDKRRGYDVLSDRVFMFVLGLYVVGGLLASTFMAALSYHWQAPNLIVVLVLGLGLPILGIMISFKSDDWMISTLGYALVVVPFGVLLGPVVALYQLQSVIQVVATTLVVSAALWAVGMLIPPIVQNWSAYIIGALLILIAGDLTRLVMPIFGLQPVTLQWWAWVGVILFSGLIVYDVNKAMQRPKTLNNAVDAAVGIYLDILNLFLRLLEIMGKKKK